MFVLKEFRPDHIETKVVNYFGINITIPVEAEAITVDKCGNVAYHLNKPKVSEEYGIWFCMESDACCIGEVTFEGDWRDSLMELELE